MMLVLYLSTGLIFGALITEFRFFKNFGQTFLDYSLNNNNGTNGADKETDSQDTFATDRGAYFSSSSKITIPSEKLEKLSVLLWIKFTSPSSSGCIYSRKSLPNEEFSLFFKYSLSYSINLVLKENEIEKNIEISTTDILSWVFISSIVDDDDYELCVNANNCVKDTYKYKENNNIDTYLGAGSTRTSFIGFLFNFRLFNKKIEVSDYIGGYSSTCFIPSTCLDCFISHKKNSVDYCLPENTDPRADSFGNNCSNNDFGCSGEVALNCICAHQSCILYHQQVICLCNSNSQGTSNDCSCSPTQVFNGSECIFASNTCTSEYCATCDIENTCKSCKDPNSVVSESTCVCKTGYSIAVDATETERCVSCDTTCKQCYFNLKCQQCQTSGYQLDENDEKKCKKPEKTLECQIGFYLNQENCEKCDEKCFSCSDSLSCETCLLDSMIFIQGELCTCKTNQVFKSSSKTCECLPGFYLKDENSGCYQCPQFCLKCDEKVCFTCFHNFELKNNSCICPSGTFLTPSNNCQKCLENCEKCENYYSCVKCSKNFKINSKGNCECLENFFPFENECRECGRFCLKCNETYCFQCKENSSRSKGNSCECDLGFADEETCVQLMFSGKLKVDKNNKIDLELEKELKVELEKNDFRLSFQPESKIDFKFSSELKVYTFQLVPKESIKKKTLVLIEIVTEKELKSKDNQILNQRSFISEIFEYKMPYQSSKSIQKVANNTQTIATSAACFSLTVALMSNPAGLWIFMNTLEIISFLPLNRVPYPDQLKNFFTSFGTFNLIPNPLKDFVSFDKSLTPYKEAKNYGYETSLFYINAGSHLINLVFFLVLFPFLYMGNRWCFKYLSKKCEKWLKNYRYNFFLRFWIQSYLNLTILAAIQLKSGSRSSIWSLVSIILSYIIVVRKIQIFSIFSLLFIIGFGYLNREEILNNQENFMKRWGSIFEEFKNNKKFLSTQFYSVFLMRRFLFVLSQVYLNEHVYLQQALNIVGSVFQFIFMIYFLPFKEGVVGISSYCGELCTLVVMIVSVVFVKEPGEETINLLENFIVFSVLTTIFIQSLVSVILGFKCLKQFFIWVFESRIFAFLRKVKKVSPTDLDQKSEIVITGQSELNQTSLQNLTF